jgi:hypothetical protein
MLLQLHQSPSLLLWALLTDTLLHQPSSRLTMLSSLLQHSEPPLSTQLQSLLIMVPSLFKFKDF